MENVFMFQKARCLWSATECYEVGKIYPVIGWNNGTHIIGIDKHGDIHDGCGENHGDEIEVYPYYAFGNGGIEAIFTEAF